MNQYLRATFIICFCFYILTVLYLTEKEILQEEDEANTNSLLLYGFDNFVMKGSTGSEMHQRNNKHEERVHKLSTLSLLQALERIQREWERDSVEQMAIFSQQIKEQERQKQLHRKKQQRQDQNKKNAVLNITTYSGPLTQANDLSMLNRTKIVTFITSDYYRIALRWYDRLQTLGYRNQYIVCTEQEAFDKLQSSTFYRQRYPRIELHLLPRLSSSGDKTYGYGKKMRYKVKSLFALRWTYTLNHLLNGHHVLVSDADAIWNSYRTMEILERSEFDVHHALETKHPLDVYHRIGFCVNGGMGWYRSTPRTINFIRRLVEKCNQECDDQVVMNRILAYDLNMTWNSSLVGPRQQDVREHDENDPHGLRLHGLIEDSFSGWSPITGHKVYIWSRHECFRGENEPQTCPQDNWVSMPFVSMKSRRHGSMRKLRGYDVWDKACGPNEYTLKRQRQRSLWQYNNSSNATTAEKNSPDDFTFYRSLK